MAEKLPTTFRVQSTFHSLRCLLTDAYIGSPLNRVSFLRTDHTFLSAALRHPTTSFLLFNNLNPLAKDPTKLAYASYQDVRALIGDDPYGKSEKELIAEYNSTRLIPQLIFLGLDEKHKQGLEWNVYNGAPYFALDVTPRGSIEEAVKGVIKEMESRGLSFVEGRMHMSLPAPEGTCSSLVSQEAFIYTVVVS